MTFTGQNDTRKDDLFKAVRALGVAEGQGKNSRPEFGLALFTAAAQGFIQSSLDEKKAPDDVGPLYLKYLEGATNNKTGYAYKGVADDNPKSRKAQISKARQLVIVGNSPMFSATRTGNENAARDFAELMDARIANLAKQSTKAVPVYDKYISVMRAQRAKIKAGKNEPLTMDEIDAAIITVKADPEELSTIKSIAGRLRKLAEGDLCAGSIDHLLKAASALQPRIEELEKAEKEQDLEADLAEISDEQIAALMAKRAAAKLVETAPEMQIAAE
jgi:hypothetical protein